MTPLEKELLAALKREHLVLSERFYPCDMVKPCDICQLIAKAEAQEAGDE